MEDWIKIQSFDRIHQAELRKDILEQNGIQAVIINERDSLFLIGEIELYVKKDDEKKARALIDEFSGLSKINSFIIEKPILRLHNILKNNNIESEIKRKEDSRFVLENFELYINNQDLAKVIPYLTGEKLEGWSIFEKCTRTRQTRFRVEILEENGIETIVVKKKDTHYHLEEISLFVPTDKLESAQQIITELNGWIKLETYDKKHRAEIREDLLGKYGIKAIIKMIQPEKFTIFVECNNEEKAIEAIQKHKEWTKIKSLENLIEADFYKEYLTKSGVDAIIVNRSDRSFLIGDADLYVDDFMVEKALEIIRELENNK